MAESPQPERIAELERRVAALSTKLVDAKDAVQTWVDANTSLSRSAASARAENQGSGRGFFGALLGSKVRGILRSGAAASNAAIAKDVAAKRARIAEGKREAQEAARSIQEALAAAKAELKALTVGGKARAQTKTVAAKATSTTLDLLQKLKEARDAGLLTEAEYEEKRKKLVSEL